MRKRSGALHSESEEQFLLLAELSHQKTGYFYDEALHSAVNQQLQKHKAHQQTQPPPSNNFKGFDFCTQDLEKQEEQTELKIQSKAELISIVLICKCQTDIKLILAELWPNTTENEVQSPQIRKMDLFIAKNKHPHFETCLKFWIMEVQQVSNPIYHSYLNKAARVLNFSEESEVGELHPLSRARQVLGALQAESQS